MSVFNRLKHNRPLRWTILFAQCSLLLLASTHFHHHETHCGVVESSFVEHVGFHSEFSLNDGHNCPLCDVIQFAANGIPIEGFSFVFPEDGTPSLFRPQPVFSVCSAVYLTRGPPYHSLIDNLTSLLRSSEK